MVFRLVMYSCLFGCCVVGFSGLGLLASSLRVVVYGAVFGCVLAFGLNVIVIGLVWMLMFVGVGGSALGCVGLVCGLSCCFDLCDLCGLLCSCDLW